jgi:DNA-binding transcriptional MocR family regulator
MPIQAKRELVRLLARRDVPLIEDATFADLQFDGDMIAARSFDKSGNVILCASLAKTVAPGLRIGWIESKKHADRISFLKRVSSIGQPQISQLALAEYMSSGGYERHLKQLARILRKQIDRNLAMISERLPPEVKVVRPTGGFLLWLELPKRVDSLELHKRALDFKIGLAPGSIFSAQGRFKNYLRINCGQIPTPDIESAYIRLGNLIESLN